MNQKLGKEKQIRNLQLTRVPSYRPVFNNDYLLCYSKLYLSFEPLSIIYDSLLLVNLLFALINSFFVT